MESPHHDVILAEFAQRTQSKACPECAEEPALSTVEGGPAFPLTSHKMGAPSFARCLREGWKDRIPPNTMSS